MKYFPKLANVIQYHSSITVGAALTKPSATVEVPYVSMYGHHILQEKDQPDQVRLPILLVVSYSPVPVRA